MKLIGWIASFLSINRTTKLPISSSMIKRESPSAERNKEPIAAVLDALQPKRVLEVAAGAGIHARYFGERWKIDTYIPTDRSSSSGSSSSLDSIRAYSAEIPGVLQDPLPLTLDEAGIIESDTDKALPNDFFDTILCINMIHIAPWSATIGLMKMASAKLAKNGRLVLYGPYRVGGTCVESNLRFEEWLKAQDPSYGVRHLEEVTELATENALTLEKSVEMPANNLCVIFQKQ